MTQAEKEGPGPGYWFFRVPIAPLELPLSATARSVYFGLCRYAGPTGKCWPSHATLGKLVGIRSTVTVRKGLHELAEMGLIRITTRKEKGQSSIYTVLHLAGGEHGTQKEAGERRVSNGRKTLDGERNG